MPLMSQGYNVSDDNTFAFGRHGRQNNATAGALLNSGLQNPGKHETRAIPSTASDRAVKVR